MHEYRLLPAGLHPYGCAAGAGANAPPPTNVSSHGGDAAADWVVCRIFRRARPAHRARLGGGAREELEEEHAAEESPSSCVTDASETLDQEEDDGDEGSSSSTVASSN
ncbi:NAC domain-containing protein 68 [Zea mays]|nr:NAC domain-containing protein 68 [Zea mays]ONM34966.1 NAC domain-containing protein 68 [Zea mays]